MAQVPENPGVAQEPLPSTAPPPPPAPEVDPDQLVKLLAAVGQMRARMLKARKENQKEYDRLLKQTFPLDILTLVEMLAVEMGNRILATMVRCDELADAIETGHEEGDTGLTDEEADALHVLVTFVDALPVEQITPEVKAALIVLHDSGLLPEDDDDDDVEAADENEPKDADEVAPAESASADASEEAHDDGTVGGASEEAPAAK